MGTMTKENKVKTMPAKTLMVQGTASAVGKSVLVTALCRILRQDGYRVAPFKSQNMALNSFVTREGGEIGRAQAVQAEAAGIEPSVYMNPILIKPEAEAESQVIVLGKVFKRLKATEYQQYTPHFLEAIRQSLKSLKSQYDVVLIEGAGSPAEVNLKDRDIANMRIAKMAGAEVLLVGDIDRGGVFASLYGTLLLLAEKERRMVKGLVINKFRGDAALLTPGLKMLERKTGKAVLGVIPYWRDMRIAQEDSVYLEERKPGPKSGDIDITIIHLPHIANFDDFDPLEAAVGRVCYVREARELGKPDLVILPGSKSTIHDLLYLRRQGLDRAIIEQSRAGTPVIGICGGYQMLGKMIYDPEKMESQESAVPGLGLLESETRFGAVKTTTRVKARVIAEKGLFAGLRGMAVSGYEIHMGQTDNAGAAPVFQIEPNDAGRPTVTDGAVSENGLVFGTYLHGLFQNEDFTHALLAGLRRRGAPIATTANSINTDPYGELAEMVRKNLNMPEVYRILMGE
jgi:adenosylcobyric acid synthase